MVVIIPKGVGTNLRRIGLVEVMWKAISGIIDRRILSSIQFHDDLHGFSMGGGTENATLEANLIKQLIAMRETVNHSIFLDLRKAYYALDRDFYMDIMAGYGVGPRTLRILQTYWDQIQMA